MSDTNRHKLIIIGCGASGMAAAISAAVYEKDILILERNPVPGKKIPATGNGKCNFTNLQVSENELRSSSGDAFSFYKRFDNSDVLGFFKKLGVPAFIKNGYCYPHSNQASSIRDALVNRLDELGIRTVYDCRAKTVEKTDNGFKLKCGTEEYFCERLIIAAGGQASPCFGTDGSFYYICRKLGHTVVEPLPALTGLTSGAAFLKDIAGVRHEANVSLLVDSKVISAEYGEIIFNKSGISGIPVMNASAAAARAINDKKPVSISLDFFPDITGDELSGFLKNHFDNSSLRLDKCLTGVLNDKLTAVILRECGIPADHSDRSGDNTGLFDRLAGVMKHFGVQITGTAGFENAQTTAGGIPLSELDGTTLESLICPGLYIVGELADVDGRCGGYNLQWAWTSGVIAGAYAGGGEFDKTKLITA
ncbi:MAG: aminoacetone oxidase family FAD-binding enzyme [Lachnospiraceae bacterium]|nr:aminoacetone oxidase family FAD-binding enzyme [Lachnospiraceae bacterium]